MKRRGYSETTLERVSKDLKQISKECDLNNPFEVLDYVMNRDCSNIRKEKLLESYKKFAEEYNIPFEMPRIIVDQKDPYIPTEEDIDILIGSLPLRTSVFCQFLKETACRCGEAWNLKWEDIDFTRRLVRITPEKNSNPRTIKISKNLIDRINMLKTSEKYVFRYKSDNLKTITRLFERQRNRISKIQQNPKLKLIHFHTFRHWKATMEYIKTRDILHVKTLLGHKNVNNTLKYIRYAEALESREDEWTCRVANNIDEAKKLIESGFEYVTTFEDKMLFRKRK